MNEAHPAFGERGSRCALVSIVVPVFNEEDAVALFVETVSMHLPAGIDHEIVFVNDGSRDDTLAALLALQAQNPVLRIVDLSRNFGKEAAMSAGLQHAKGDAVIVIDVDLQEPPELIPAMIAKWQEGFDVVYGQRVSRASDSPLKRVTAGGFYTWFNRMADFKIPADVGDFRLMDRAVVETLNALPERVRFMKGLFAWVGFKTYALEFERRERQAGTTKFNYWRLWNFALDGITSFSTFPLRIWSYVGLATAGLSFLYGTLIILKTLIQGVDVPGYASLLTVTLFLGGVQLIGLGVLGEYLGRVYIEVKQRPLFVANKVYEERQDGQAARGQGRMVEPASATASNRGQDDGGNGGPGAGYGGSQGVDQNGDQSGGQREAQRDAKDTGPGANQDFAS
ncbi:glycosyltransferase family 2 protein [Rhizobium sp. SSA_523]|uniref:glycosyltransferase family 2 protein n=1 Tax=Rhizobium sp. SSA_523 TaxID=2952477 RepID=UPI0020908349|nr:glycosyltransferase family 2 protein [Rhizobium sp. SSA_523]MCO5734700.1 glycosyltransferase family 2 protein [Rhizobium sp. SSA_523]WKC20974.1 glycosyltransferase family 2 protein [Rhizobium sp. SSA_523]